MAKDKTLLIVGAAGLIGYALWSSSQKKSAATGGSSGTTPTKSSTSSSDLAKSLGDDAASLGKSLASLFGGSSGTASGGGTGAKNVTDASDPASGSYVQEGSGGQTNDQFFGDPSNFGE